MIDEVEAGLYVESLVPLDLAAISSPSPSDSRYKRLVILNYVTFLHIAQKVIHLKLSQVHFLHFTVFETFHMFHNKQSFFKFMLILHINKKLVC